MRVKGFDNGATIQHCVTASRDTGGLTQLSGENAAEISDILRNSVELEAPHFIGSNRLHVIARRH